MARASLNTVIPWLLEKDTQLLVHCENGEKRLKCLSTLTAGCAQQSGVTELSLLDHDLVQTVDEKDGPKPFRYGVKPRALINVFQSKLVETEDGAMMRSSVMGAKTSGGFKKLVQSSNARQVWEASRWVSVWERGSVFLRGCGATRIANDREAEQV